MIAVGKTVIIELKKKKDAAKGEVIQENGLIAIGGNDTVEDILKKWEGDVISIGDEIPENTPVKVGNRVRIMENSGIPISESETDEEFIRCVSVRYGDILAVV